MPIKSLKIIIFLHGIFLWKNMLYYHIDLSVKSCFLWLLLVFVDFFTADFSHFHVTCHFSGTNKH